MIALVVTTKHETFLRSKQPVLLLTSIPTNSSFRLLPIGSSAFSFARDLAFTAVVVSSLLMACGVSGSVCGSLRTSNDHAISDAHVIGHSGPGSASAAVLKF